MSRDQQVPSVFEREDDSVPGAFYVVKGLCVHCAITVETAPSSVSWGTSNAACPHHCRVEHQPRNEAELSNIINAACRSCVEAIRYCGTDPAVIARFRERARAHLCDALAARP